MTMNAAPSAPVTATVTAAASNAESRLRKVLLANTEFSILSGLAGLILGRPVADALGVDQVWLIRLLGAGLLGFAGVVYLVARSPRLTLQTWSLQISLADMGWVVGTIAVIALGWLSNSGAIIMALIAAAVLGLGVGQYMARRSMIATA